MKRFTYTFTIDAETSEQAEEIKMELAGSNDGSELIANADIEDVEEL